MDEKVSDAERTLGAIAYVGPLWIITRCLRAGSDYCRFHARQGCMLFLVECIAAVLMVVVNSTIGRVPIFGPIVVAISGFAIWTAVFLISLGGVTNAAKGKTWRIPFLGHHAEMLQM